MTTNGIKPNIPDIVIGRLPIYLRALNRLAYEGNEVTSSHELGKRLGISSAQIRKDLSHFGGFGKQGTGYQIAFLEEKLREVLKVDQEWEVALIGTGDLGRAIARHYHCYLSHPQSWWHLYPTRPSLPTRAPRVDDCRYPHGDPHL